MQCALHISYSVSPGFDCKNHAALDDDMHEVICALKDRLQCQDGTDLLQLRQLLFDFVSLNPKFQFYFGVHATNGHVQLYAPFLMLIVAADRCAKF